MICTIVYLDMPICGIYIDLGCFMSEFNKSVWLETFSKVMPDSILGQVDLILLDECESTMLSVRSYFNQHQEDLFVKSIDPQFLWCFALEQTKGVGRQKRAWVSPKSEGMYLSVLMHEPIEYNRLNGLSLAIGTSVAGLLCEYGIKAQLKWPNDILVKGKKISGVLIETFTSQEDPTKCHVVIGVGLNINQVDLSGIPNATSLYSELGHEIPYEDVCLRMAVQLSQDFAVYKQSGFSYFIESWRSLSIMSGVKVRNPEGQVLGKILDIDEEGALLLEGEGGVSRILSYDDRLQYEF